MNITKPAAFLYILTGVALGATCIASAIADREASTTYDMSGIQNLMTITADTAAKRIGEQEASMNNLVSSTYASMKTVITTTDKGCASFHKAIAVPAVPTK